MYSDEQALAKKTSVMTPLPFDRFLCGFAHIFAGGYSAGVCLFHSTSMSGKPQISLCLLKEDGVCYVLKPVSVSGHGTAVFGCRFEALSTPEWQAHIDIKATAEKATADESVCRKPQVTSATR